MASGNRSFGRQGVISVRIERPVQLVRRHFPFSRLRDRTNNLGGQSILHPVVDVALLDISAGDGGQSTSKLRLPADECDGAL